MWSQNEIIEAAVQLGFDERLSNNWLVSEEQLMRFVKLIAAKERSHLAQEVEDIRSDECDFKKFEDTHNDGWLDACNAILDTIYGWGRDFESRE